MSDENATAPEVGHVLPILQVPDPRLKTRSRRVTPADRDWIAELVPAMFRTMYAAPGIGLAAPQVGEPLRLVVVDVAPEGEHNPLVLINPEVASAGGEPSTREEGCLSIPGVYADVTRPGSVSVRYEDEDGAKHTIEADGLLAACLQHEIDHLDGILFLDHLSALKRNMLLRRLAKERRQKASA